MKCKRCSGSGEAFGGVCFGCGGSGEVEDVRYTTTSPQDSQHPAMRAERELKPLEFVPPDPKHVKARLAEMKLMLETPEVEAEVVEEIKHWECEHTFHVEHYRLPQCTKCGVFEAQFQDNINIQLEYGANDF